MRPLAGGVIFGWFFLGTWCALACGDGGTMRMSGKKGGFLITVFTAPAPFRAGPVDISVLVQDALTGEPMPLTRVTVRMTKPGPLALEYPATREAATNKLLHAAQFELPEPGRWQLEVQVEGVHGLAVIGGELEAAAPLPRWRELLWPWIAWPALAIALFGIRQALAQRWSGKQEAIMALLARRQCLQAAQAGSGREKHGKAGHPRLPFSRACKFNGG